MTSNFLWGLVAASCLTGQNPSPTKDASDAFFANGAVPELRLYVEPAEAKMLRENPRAYVRARLKEDANVEFRSIGVKLKGAAGSFRGFDDRPALTLNMNRFDGKPMFHGLDKFHLNNSVQDESYLHEWVSSELARRAGIPAARVAHARVWINDRDLGVYVFKEGFDRRFLKRHFPSADGNLYDGGFLMDVDAELEKDLGQGPDDRSDLIALRRACAEPDLAARWKKLEELLDIDAFLSFVALEFMACHWDGYAANKNNYRLYFLPTNGKAYFLPHGMDQMFGDPGFPVMRDPGAIVSAAVLQNPLWRAKYRARVKQMLPLFSPADGLIAQTEMMRQRLRPVFEKMNPGAARAFDDRVRGFQGQLRARAENLREQLARPEPVPLVFEAGKPVIVENWYAAKETENAQHAEGNSPDGRPALKISGAGRVVASWRSKVFLAAGRYRFEGRARVEKVEPLDDPRGVGAGFRISGQARTDKLTGTSNWTDLRYEIDVAEPMREVELVAELRAAGGQVWFERGSLRLARVEK